MSLESAPLGNNEPIPVEEVETQSEGLDVLEEDIQLDPEKILEKLGVSSTEEAKEVLSRLDDSDWLVLGRLVSNEELLTDGDNARIEEIKAQLAQ